VLRFQIHIATQDLPQHTACRGEVLPMPRKVKPLGAFFLIRRKGVKQLVNSGRILIQDGAPDMHLAA
jgi:hypothetical protein